MQKSIVKKPISVLLSLLMLLSVWVFVTPAAQAVDTGKALQLVQNGAAVNVEGAQGSCVYFGNYMQSSASSKEPVKWRVLSNADGKLFLLSDQNLDVVPYNKSYTDVTWETCTLRAWLNGYDGNPYDDTFIDSAFSDKEAVAVAETVVVTDNNPYGTSGGNDTTDKVFLLSIAEAKNTAYGFTDNNNNTDTRVATNTAYVASGGHTGDGVYAAGEAARWHLRSPGRNARLSVVVFIDGKLNIVGSAVNDTGRGTAVRPAFNLNLNAVLFASAAENGKAGDGALATVANYTGNEWKLTLLDSTRNFAVTETAAAASDGSVTLNYTGAATGDNEYISVILADADGSAVYYGRLAQSEAADGSVTVDLPELPMGSYTLKVFNEQYNGDYKTDYASAFSNVALTVGTVCELNGHSYGTPIYSWTQSGSTWKCTATRTCANDTSHVETEIATATGSVTTQPTCTSQGVTTYTATFSNEAFATQTKVVADVPANGHAYVSHDAKAPTCTEIGWNAYRTCSKCDYTEYVEIPANGHTYVNHEAQAPTCTEIGWDAYRTCENCDYTTYVEIPATGDHTYGTTGAARYTCTSCGTVDAEREAAAVAADNQAAADAVIALIDAIGTVNDSEGSKAKIEAAREAYDKLTDAQKALVSNKATLEQAEASYTALTEKPCKYCGEIHDSSIGGGIMAILHALFYFILHIVGKR